MLYPAQLLPEQTPKSHKSKRTKTAPEVGLSKRQEELLQTVHQLRYVTAWDITRLYYSLSPFAPLLLCFSPSSSATERLSLV
jgi:hypothetical protein